MVRAWPAVVPLVLLLSGLPVVAVEAKPAPGTSAPPAATPAAPATSPPAATAANAPEAPDPALPATPLTVDEAIAIAYRNHGNIAVAQSSLASARTRVTQARAATLPDVTAGINYQGRGVNDIGSVFGSLPQSTNFDAGLQPVIQLRNTLFDSGQTRLAVRSARASVRGAEAGLANTRVNLGFDVTNNFYEQLRAQKLEDLSRQQVRQAEEQLQLVEARVAAGTAADVDRYQVQVELANARVTLLRNQNQVRQNGAALRASMGLPVGTLPRLTEAPPPAADKPLPEAPSIQDAMAEASRNHPQLLQEEAAVDSARAELRLAGLRRRPVVSTTTAFNLNPRDNRTRSDWTVLASVSMPIWDAGVTRSRQLDARYNLEGAEAREQQTRIDLTTSVQQAVLNIQNAKERVDASAVAVDSATRNLEAANARYLQGVLTVVDITTAQLNYFQAQNNAISALYDYYIAQAQLKRAVGR